MAAPHILVCQRADSDHVPMVVRWVYLLFIFSIPFEAAALSFTSSTFSLAKLTGLAFFVLYLYCYFPLPFRQRSFPGISPAVVCFLLYFILYICSGMLLKPTLLPNFYAQLFTLIQLFVFFWISSDLLKDEKLARQAMLIYTGAAIVLALGTIFRLPGFVGVPEVGIGPAPALGGRTTALAENPNTIGTLLALGAVALIGLRLNTASQYPLSALGFLLLLLPLLAGIVSTGSRAGMGALLIGLLVYAVPRWRSRHPVIAILMALLGIGATVFIILHDPLAASRWSDVLQEGKLAGREDIIPATLIMIDERPFLGWGPIAAQIELGKRLGTGVRDAHNLLLHLWLEGGFIGALPFLLGLAWCTHAAWKARAGPLGLMPLALFMTTLAANMSHTYLGRKPLWLVLALTLAGGSLAARAQRPRVRIQIVRKGQQVTA
jgi:O-antigen ligase